MPFVRTALMATAACLIGAAAYAQPSTDAQTMPQASPDSTTSAPTSDMNAPATADTDAAPTGAAANTSATVTSEVIASQPVPDTPANRRAFGAPLSRAGKMTRPAGN